MKNTQVARLLAYVTGMVNQQVLLQNEYLIAENRILRAHLPARLRLTDPQRSTLAEIGKRLGRQALQRVACFAKPEIILAWYRKLIARKFDGSKYRCYATTAFTALYSGLTAAAVITALLGAFVRTASMGDRVPSLSVASEHS